MTDMTPIASRLTPERARTLLEAAGAEKVSIKVRTLGSMWAFFSYFGERRVWGIRANAFERNFARDVANTLKTANQQPL